MNLYLLLSSISIICLGLQFEPLSHLMAWQLSDIEHGQWWRILTGNFTHTNFAHLAMNLLGLWVIGYIFKPNSRSLSLLVILISVWIGISLLFTDMYNYVGLSGTLHGLFAYYALREALQGRKNSWILVAGVLVKVASEQWFGASASTAQLIEAEVATGAHLSGLIAGLLFAFSAHLKSRSMNK